MVLSTVLLLALPLSALAFQNTVPLVAFSSQPLASIDALAKQVESNGPVIDAEEVYGSVFGGKEGCGLDGVMVVDLPGLHTSDLPLLLPLLSSPSLSSPLSTSPSLQIPYLLSPSPSTLYQSLLASLFEACPETQAGSLEFYPLGSVPPAASSSSSEESKGAEGRRVGWMINEGGDELNEEIGGEERRAEVFWQANLLAKQIQSFTDTYPSHLIILTSTTPFSTLSPSSNSSSSSSSSSSPEPLVLQTRRSSSSSQTPESLSSPSSDSPSILKSKPSSPKSSSSPTHGHNSTDVSNLPLLSRYTILSTPIISALLVSFGLFIPIVGFAVYAVAGIQVPRRMTEVKGVMGMGVGEGKKNQ